MLTRSLRRREAVEMVWSISELPAIYLTLWEGRMGCNRFSDPALRGMPYLFSKKAVLISQEAVHHLHRLKNVVGGQLGSPSRRCQDCQEYRAIEKAPLLGLNTWRLSSPYSVFLFVCHCLGHGSLCQSLHLALTRSNLKLSQAESSGGRMSLKPLLGILCWVCF